MLREATAALSRLDAAALEDLERRACALRDALASGDVARVDAPNASELKARYCVFSDVVTEMSKDLSMLRRTCVAEQAQYGPEAGVRWVR